MRLTGDRRPEGTGAFPATEGCAEGRPDRDNHKLEGEHQLSRTWMDVGAGAPT